MDLAGVLYVLGNKTIIFYFAGPILLSQLSKEEGKGDKSLGPIKNSVL